MFTRLAVLAAVVFCVAGCAPWRPARMAGFPDGTSIHTIDIGGRKRSYRVYKPSALSGPAPLVVMLHGGFGSARQAEKAYGWDKLADTAKFVVAYPDGVARAWNAGGGCCGPPYRDGVNDVGFITATVTEVSRGIGIDASRVYVTGISNGGMMSYMLACNTAIFAAIGPDSATQLDPCRSPHPTSVLHIHGTADQLVPYRGGPGVGFVHLDGPAVPQVNAFWRNVEHCGAPTVTASGPVTTSTAKCPDNRGVVLITVDGGGHDWPDFATQKLWEFFAQHR